MMKKTGDDRKTSRMGEDTPEEKHDPQKEGMAKGKGERRPKGSEG